jgi:acyl dehydratase
MTPMRELQAVYAGQELTPKVRYTTTAQLVRYAAGANDYSGIHFDLDYAHERGFPTVIVHGLLKAAFLAEFACEWGGARSWMRTFASRYQAIDVVGAPIICRGRVVEVLTRTSQISLDLWTENPAGERTTTATGLLQLEPGATNV